jgi:hypothetical protein
MKYPSDEFDAALSAVCDGTAAEAQSRALADLLREDSDARDAYLFAVELHARLASDNALFFAPQTEDRVDHYSVSCDARPRGQESVADPCLRGGAGRGGFAGGILYQRFPALLRGICACSSQRGGGVLRAF